jgi:hypothetical protein
MFSPFAALRAWMDRRRGSVVIDGIESFEQPVNLVVDLG